MFHNTSRFRLIITVTKADLTGKILSRMSQGTCISYEHLDDAVAAQTEFHMEADAVIRGGRVSEFKACGASFVQDERDGCVHNLRSLWDGYK